MKQSLPGRGRSIRENLRESLPASLPGAKVRGSAERKPRGGLGLRPPRSPAPTIFLKWKLQIR